MKHGFNKFTEAEELCFIKTRGFSITWDDKLDVLFNSYILFEVRGQEIKFHKGFFNYLVFQRYMYISTIISVTGHLRLDICGF